MTDEQILEQLDFTTPAFQEVCDIRPGGYPCGDAARSRLECQVCEHTLSVCPIHRAQMSAVVAMQGGMVFCSGCQSHTHRGLHSLFDEVFL